MSFLELLAWSVWDLLRPRKLMTLLLVGLAGPLLATLLRLNVPEGSYNPQFAYGMTVPTAVYAFTMVLLCIVFASGIVSSEMVGKTIQYLLTRPIPRYKILLAKWLGAVIVVSLGTMLSCALTGIIAYGPGGIGESNLLRDLMIIPVGVATYCSLFTMLSVLTSKPWIIAIAFGFLWESWVSLVPGDFQKLSVMAHLRALSPQPALPQNAPSDIFEAWKVFNQQIISPATAWNSVALITIISLAIGCAVFSSAEFVPKDEAA
jgi:ABC-2 type transport system permease protein